MSTINLKNKVVITGALDWGLGHLTRLITLMKKSEVSQWLILATADQKKIYQKDFPKAIFYETESLNWQWSGTQSAVKEMFRQRKKWNRQLRSDQKLVEEIVIKHKVDSILSDNRYGLYHENIPSIILTHQLNLPTSLIMKSFAQKKLSRYLSPFHEIWVPDYIDHKKRLSGKLSEPPEKLQPKVHFIGPLCRFSWDEKHQEKTGTTILLSGPEPQRKKFLLDLLTSFSSDENLTIIAPQIYSDISLSEKQSWLENPDEVTLQKVLKNSKTIISRAGYSTIMEIHKLQNTKKIIVPTPYQNEQNYLGKHLNGQWGFNTVNQKNN